MTSTTMANNLEATTEQEAQRLKTLPETNIVPIKTDDDSAHADLPLRKKGARDFRFLEASGCYAEVYNPATGTTQVWLKADTDWGRSGLGVGTEFDAVAIATMATLSKRKTGYARLFDTDVVIEAAKALSEKAFPRHNPQDLLDRRLPAIQHGQNVMLVPNGALTVEVALRAAQQYFGTKKNHGLEKLLTDSATAYTAQHQYDYEEQYFYEAANQILAELPEPIKQERYKALVTSLLANERSAIFNHVMGKHLPRPTIDTIIDNAPPDGETAKDVFEKLTGHTIDSEAEARLNAYLGRIVKDRITHSTHHQLNLADNAPDKQHPSPAAILNTVLKDVLQPSGFMISYAPSYHGATVGANALRANNPALFSEDTFTTDKVIFATMPHPYRQIQADETNEEYVARLLREMEQKILLAGGKGSVAAIFVEPISGSSMGGIPLPEGYLEGLHALSKKYGPKDGEILLVYDEVMSGMGRTGTFFAYQHPTIGGESPTPPHILLSSKALSSGASSASAVVFRHDVMAELAQAKVSIGYSTTGQNHPVDATAILETIHQVGEIISGGRLAKQGQELKREITQLLERNEILKEHVGQIRGFGHMLGIELVDSESTKEQIKRGTPLALLIYDKALLEGGVSVLPVAACRDGAGDLINSDTVFLLPPFTMTSLDIKRLAKRLVRVMEATVAEVKGIPVPKYEEEPLNHMEAHKIRRNIEGYKARGDNLEITKTEEGGISIIFSPNMQSPEESLSEFRRKLMPASGGYTAKQDGENWVFQLTAEQGRGIVDYEKSIVQGRFS